MKILAAVVGVLAIACATFSLDRGAESILPMQAAEGGTCTAFAVAPERWITATHCLVLADDWMIGGVKSEALAADSHHDIALVSGPVGRALQIAAEPPPIGATVRMWGYGMGQKDLLFFSVNVMTLESDFFKHTAAQMLVTGSNGIPGMSGGPIMYQGKVVSVQTGGGFSASPAHQIGTGASWAALSAFAKKYVSR